MKHKKNIVSYTLAIMAGISFVCGVAVLSVETGLYHE